MGETLAVADPERRSHRPPARSSGPRHGLSRRGLIAAAGALAAWPAMAVEGYTEAQLNNMFKAGGEDAIRAADYIVSHPEVVTPLSVGNAMLIKWRTGERLQGAFCLYLYQLRMMPWAAITPAMKEYYDDQMAAGGEEVDNWATSDFTAWRGLVRRVIAYEKKTPLYATHPGEMSDADWQALVAKAREVYAGNFEQAFGGMTAEKAAERRKEQMLYVGPWQEPGSALLDNWR